MPRDRHASADELPAPGHADVSGMAPDPHYEIRVLGSLDGHWAAWFEGLQVSSDGSQTDLQQRRPETSGRLPASGRNEGSS